MANCVRRLWSSAITLVAIAGSATAGGSGESVLIIANPSSHDALAAANYYKAARNIPDANVLYIDPAAIDFASFVDVNLPAFLGTLEQRVIADHIDQVLIMPGTAYSIDAPNLVPDSCPSPIREFSTASCYTMAFIADDVLNNAYTFSETNRYSAGANNPVHFDSETSYLSGQPSTDADARRYFIGSMLGYTGNNGNTLQEIYDMVDRSVGADGTRPNGTFYFMNFEADPARNVRAGTYPNAITKLAQFGGSGLLLDGKVPVGQHDCLGIMTGFANINLPNQNLTLIPGAFTDHLTSWAATFDIDAQLKVSDWIRKGASGSFGAIEEPCNIVGKFPKANTHGTYFQGLSLGEAVFRGLLYVPFQGLIYGDPLTRPFAHIPTVDVPDAPTSAVSGTIVLSPVASTTHPSGSIESLDLVIDGVVVDSIADGGVFNIDTTDLDEGHHTVRILAADDTGVRSVGRWIGSLDVDNTSHGAAASASSSTGDLSSAFQISVSGAGGLTDGARIWSNGRVVASLDAVPGSATVHGRLLGAGLVDVRVEVLFDDGTRAWAEPFSLIIDDVDPGSSTVTPEAFGYTRAVNPAHPFVLELPSNFSESLEDAAWTVVSPLTQSTMHAGTGPYRVCEPNEGASGLDTMTFSVTTTAGTSALATITVDYGSDECVADLAAPFGVLDFFDVQAFLGAFSSMDPSADLAPPMGVFDFFDVAAFLSAFSEGCP